MNKRTTEAPWSHEAVQIALAEKDNVILRLANHLRQVPGLLDVVNGAFPGPTDEDYLVIVKDLERIWLENLSNLFASLESPAPCIHETWVMKVEEWAGLYKPISPIVTDAGQNYLLLEPKYVHCIDCGQPASEDGGK